MLPNQKYHQNINKWKLIIYNIKQTRSRQCLSAACFCRPPCSNCCGAIGGWSACCTKQVQGRDHMVEQEEGRPQKIREAGVLEDARAEQIRQFQKQGRLNTTYRTELYRRERSQKARVHNTSLSRHSYIFWIWLKSESWKAVILRSLKRPFYKDVPMLSKFGWKV